MIQIHVPPPLRRLAELTEKAHRIGGYPQLSCDLQGLRGAGVLIREMKSFIIDPCYVIDPQDEGGGMK